MARSSSRVGRLAQLGRLTTRLSSGFVGQRVRSFFTDDAGREALQDRFAREGAEQLVATLGHLRGAAMKVGQAISVAVEHLDLPDDVRAQLTRLQDRGEAVPFEQICRVVERELGVPVEQVFARFDPEPLGTASLAQAHAAALYDGTEVVVKVLHEGVEDGVETDLVALRTLLLSARAFGRGRDEMDGIFDEIRLRLREELDYFQEAANIAAFRAAFARDDGRVRIPRPYTRLCTDRLLVMDRLAGLPLATFLANADAATKQRAGENLASLLLSMVFEHRMLHADPHPGNYLFEDDGRIGLLDFGCVKRFDVQWIGQYARVALAALDNDREAALDGLRVLSVWDGRDPDVGDLLWAFCQVIAGPLGQGAYRFGSDDDAIMAHVFPVLLRIKETTSIVVPRDVVFLHRTLAGIYTIERQLGVAADWGELLRASLPQAVEAMRAYEAAN